ncbi:hypothetical protein ACO22_02369 [Paracoccidioides brasiliensis]|uniref:Uncharacterized protein n=1 Tax=Paracoccidioides brasiliensis TaxID=121759 RepID=A0A1D2JJ09_PARBR|nr:hypothetical protein ACO22_02369 [Paracoccidioides brasiliensis]
MSRKHGSKNSGKNHERTEKSREMQNLKMSTSQRLSASSCEVANHTKLGVASQGSYFPPFGKNSKKLLQRNMTTILPPSHRPKPCALSRQISKPPRLVLTERTHAR